MSFSTRIKVVDVVLGQVIPLQAAGLRPESLARVRLEGIDKTEDIEPPKSYVRKYVS